MNADEAVKSLQKQLNGGTSSLVLMALLVRKRKPMYGYQIARELERQTGGELPMKPGALYPALRSLEKQGLLSSHTELSGEGRARKYYKPTKTGAATMKHWREAWEETKSFVDTILGDRNVEASSRRDAPLSTKSGTRTSKRSS